MKALAFIDLLGFSQMVANNHDKSKQILSDFYNIAFNVINNENEIIGHLFSDSLLAYSSEPHILVNNVTKIYRECMKKNKSYEFDLSKYFLLPRGGISFGLVDIQNRNEASNLSKNFIVSPALVHSAKIESQIKGSRLLIADTNNNSEHIFTWNSKIKSILYENSTFTYWSDFKYYDALWFLDLTKNPNEQKKEVTELVNIAFDLVNSNVRNKKVIEQHLQTLRIGLLSYTRFLSSGSSPIIFRIINDFADNKYWLIWITLFEMIMQSPDSWAFSTNSEIIDFYKSVSLKSAWAEVIKYINKPRNEYLKNLLNSFVQKLAISEM